MYYMLYLYYLISQFILYYIVYIYIYIYMCVISNSVGKWFVESHVVVSEQRDKPKVIQHVSTFDKFSC